MTLTELARAPGLMEGAIRATRPARGAAGGGMLPFAAVAEASEPVDRPARAPGGKGRPTSRADEKDQPLADAGPGVPLPLPPLPASAALPPDPTRMGGSAGLGQAPPPGAPGEAPLGATAMMAGANALGTAPAGPAEVVAAGIQPNGGPIPAGGGASPPPRARSDAPTRGEGALPAAGRPQPVPGLSFPAGAQPLATAPQAEVPALQPPAGLALAAIGARQAAGGAFSLPAARAPGRTPEGAADLPGAGTESRPAETASFLATTPGPAALEGRMHPEWTDGRDQRQGSSEGGPAATEASGSVREFSPDPPETPCPVSEIRLEPAGQDGLSLVLRVRCEADQALVASGTGQLAADLAGIGARVEAIHVELSGGGGEDGPAAMGGGAGQAWGNAQGQGPGGQGGRNPASVPIPPIDGRPAYGRPGAGSDAATAHAAGGRERVDRYA